MIVWKQIVDNHKKYCEDENSTFSVRDYFDWANKKELLDNIFYPGTKKLLITSSLNKQNNSKE